MAKVSAKHHVAVPASQDLVSLKIGKDSSIYSGYQSVHEECSKLLLPLDRKTILSVKSGNSDHFHSQEAMRVIFFEPYLVLDLYINYVCTCIMISLLYFVDGIRHICHP